MPEEQANNDTKTSWSFGDFAKGLGSPLTKNEDGSYNVAGALLTGAGSGLVTWVLSRMLGIKSGPSLGISILAALAGTHGAFTKQGGLDFFSNPKGYLKDFMDKKRMDNSRANMSLDGGNTSEEDYNAAMEQNMINENVANANYYLNYGRPETAQQTPSAGNTALATGKESSNKSSAAANSQTSMPKPATPGTGLKTVPSLADIQASRQRLAYLQDGMNSRYNYLIKNNPGFRSAMDQARMERVNRDLPMTSGEDNWYKAEDMIDTMNAMKPLGYLGRYPGNNKIFPNKVEFSPIGTPLSRR